MRVEEIEEKIIYGISTRTKNSNEINPETAKIGAVWQKFDNTVEVNYKDGERKIKGTKDKGDKDTKIKGTGYFYTQITTSFQIYSVYYGVKSSTKLQLI